LEWKFSWEGRENEERVVWGGEKVKNVRFGVMQKKKQKAFLISSRIFGGEGRVQNQGRVETG